MFEPVGTEPFPLFCPGFGVLLLEGQGDQDSRRPADAILCRYDRRRCNRATMEKHERKKEGKHLGNAGGFLLNHA